MQDYIDIYCERLAPGLWAEPLNALTNLSFFIAAFFAYQLARRQKAFDLRSGLLIALLAIIGTGSGLFHTFATRWAMLADTIPILLYQIVFLTLYSRDVIGLCRFRTATFLAFFFVAIYGFGQLPAEWLNGSLAYAPAFLFLLFLPVLHYVKLKEGKASKTLLLAAGVFALSITFRSLDMALCAGLPFGTHFLWHCLNGLVLYLTTRAYILNR